MNEYDHVRWQALAANYSGHSCAPNASFATFLSGSWYTLGSVCLLRSLRKAGNRCPVDLVYDDRARMLNITGATRNFLERVYGAERLIPLSSLMVKHPTSTSDMQYSLLHRSQGRRLYQLGVQLYATHSKIWLWALPRARVVLLDADMVVVGKLDWLNSLTLTEDVAAIDISNRHTNASESKFNSGLMVIQPSPRHIRNLTRVAVLARSPVGASGREAVPKMGEKHLGDQSLLNWYFRGTWKALPPSLVQTVHPKVRSITTRLHYSHVVLQNESNVPAVIHWLSEPKPWSRKSGMRIDTKAWDLKANSRPSPHSRLWWSLCRDHLRDAPEELLAKHAGGSLLG